MFQLPWLAEFLDSILESELFNNRGPVLFVYSPHDTIVTQAFAKLQR